MQRGNGEWYICSGGVGRVSELLHRSRLGATQCDTIMTRTELMWPALSRRAYRVVVACRRKCTTAYSLAGRSSRARIRPRILLRGPKIEPTTAKYGVGPGVLLNVLKARIISPRCDRDAWHFSKTAPCRQLRVTQRNRHRVRSE